MDQEYKEKIASSLRAKNVNKPCPRCTHLNFEIVGQTILPLNDKLNTLILGGPALPLAIIACSNCGFITLHALSSLNLMQNQSKNELK